MDRVMGSRNGKADPETEKTLRQFKYELVDRTGIKIPSDGYWGETMFRKRGYLGNYMVKKLIMLSEEQLIGRK